MKRNALICVTLLAACGGGNKNVSSTPSTDELGSTQHASGHDGQDATPRKPDPALAFRQSYQDPGGMWMPSQMTLPQHVENFQKMGVALDAKALSDPLKEPLSAVVSLGGCTGSFVSPEGLIVTNHHCVQGALQYNSDDKHDYVENGFLAATQADEPSAGPAARVMVVQAYKDVTKDMREGLDAIKDPVARKEESEKRQKGLVAACEKDRPGIRCQVSGFFGGGLYQLIEMLEIRDVRLVYAPERSIGDYGGEVDNWGWPRHTGDWSFYRAYVGKDGKPADYSKDNVPYHPAHFLKVSTAGLKPGDFVMVTGYPGRTNRLATASSVRHDVEWAYPYMIAYYQERYALAESHLNDEGETKIKAGVQKQYIQNALAKFQGILAGLQKDPELLKQKEDLDKKAKDWAAQPGNEAYKAAIDKLEALEQDQRRTARVDFDRAAAFRGSSLMSTALSLTRWAEERAKKDADRKPGFQDRDLPRALSGQKQFAKNYDRTLDRAAFRLSLVRATQLPEADRPWLATLLNAKKGQKIDEAFIDKTLDAWYKAQLLEDDKLRLELLQKGTTAELKASKDPFVQAALRIWPIVKSEEKKEDTRTGEELLVHPMYEEALKQALGGALAPDANSTLRITYGTVKSLKPDSKDPADWPFTVASQILAKDTGKDPFNSPKKLLDAIRAKHYGPFADPALGGELPVNFESDLDITGGNSGSPTLNNKGELVGLAFDGNKEGLASDVVFNGATTRTIQVDARYMIWTMHVIDGADRLIKEMGVDVKMP
ncbi:MAG TPA: S46 family peptidase [Kofleriaceae bacterium]|nr:S46 family peptidase [Kofleriaceae bacterium]